MGGRRGPFRKIHLILLFPFLCFNFSFIRRRYDCRMPMPFLPRYLINTNPLRPYRFLQGQFPFDSFLVQPIYHVLRDTEQDRHINSGHSSAERVYPILIAHGNAFVPFQPFNSFGPLETARTINTSFNYFQETSFPGDRQVFHSLPSPIFWRVQVMLPAARAIRVTCPFYLEDDLLLAYQNVLCNAIR